MLFNWAIFIAYGCCDAFKQVASCSWCTFYHLVFWVFHIHSLSFQFVHFSSHPLRSKSVPLSKIIQGSDIVIISKRVLKLIHLFFNIIYICWNELLKVCCQFWWFEARYGCTHTCMIKTSRKDLSNWAGVTPEGAPAWLHAGFPLWSYIQKILYWPL